MALRAAGELNEIVALTVGSAIDSGRQSWLI